MKKFMIFSYGVGSYLLFFLAFLYSIGFIGNLLVPKSIDSPASLPFGQALMIDLGLLALFAIQHSGMARPAFKRWLTQYLPREAERSTYVLMSTIALIAIMVFWQPLGGMVWQVSSEPAATVLLALYLASWLLLLYATFLINHFDLFGLRQVWNALRNQETPSLGFATPALYRIVRHPIYVGWLGIFWFTPTMTITHLFFAVVTSVYTIIGMKLEERDLVKELPEYQQYMRKVPALIPSPKRHLKKDSAISTVGWMDGVV
ncbi:MAG: methanethiol S-methyltransferase [Pseudomonadota bacterium]